MIKHWGHTIVSKIRATWNFIVFVVLRFLADYGLYRASALTFTSLLTIVPLMFVSISLLSAFPVFQKLMLPLQDFVFENFVPTTGKIVQQYLLNFTAQASKLPILGVLFLLFMAILMMFTIEQALNEIWQIKKRRKGISAFLLYWAILTLAPLLMGASIAVSSYIYSLPLIHGHVHEMGFDNPWLLSYAPFVLSVLTFTFLYVVVPYCKVKLLHGFIGGLVAGVLFELAKSLFAFYLKQFPTYELLYGAFATVPLFFMWVYYGWVIILIGAEVSHALSLGASMDKGDSIDGFSQAILWLRDFWDAQQKGKHLTIFDLTSNHHFYYQVSPQDMLNTLEEKKIISSVKQGQYVLTRDLSRMTIIDLYQMLPWKLPTLVQVKALEIPWFDAFEQVLMRLFNCNDKEVQNIKLQALYDKPQATSVGQ